MRCEPANSIIKRFGGLTAVSEITGVTVHSVMRWRMPRPVGAGGAIPVKHAEALIAAAKMKGISLGADDFLPSKPPEDARLAS